METLWLPASAAGATACVSSASTRGGLSHRRTPRALGCLCDTANDINDDYDSNDHHNEFQHNNHQHDNHQQLHFFKHDDHDAGELRAFLSGCVHSAATTRSGLLTDPLPQLPRDLHRPAA